MARVTNITEHVAKLKEVHGGKYELIPGQKYVSAKTKLKYRCLVNPDHGIFEMRPDNIQNGQGCQKCGALVRALKKRKSIDAHVRKVQEIHGNTILLVPGQKYKGLKKYHTYRCLANPDHGEWLAWPSNIEQGRRCPKCAEKSRRKKRRLGVVEIKSRITDIHGDSIEVLGMDEKVRTRDRVEFGCKKNIFHSTWETQLDAVLQGTGCPECAKESRKRLKTTLQDHLEKITETHEGRLKYYPNQSFNGISKKHKYICLIDITHGIWKTQSNLVEKGHGCPKCAGVNRLTHKEHLRKLREIHNGKIGLADNQIYINGKTKLKYRCLVDPTHRIWETTPFIIHRGGGCPDCAGITRKTTDDHKKKLKELHPGALELVDGQEYKNSRTKLKYRCLKDPKHGEWEGLPTNIARNKNPSGCPKCGIINGIIERLGNRKNRKGIRISLYRIIIFHKDECFFKVGYTSHSIEKRFKDLFTSFGYKIIVIEEEEGPIPEIIAKEQNFFSTTELFRYKPQKKHNGRIMSGGRYECFELPKSLEYLYFGLMGAYDNFPPISYDVPYWLEK